MRRAAIALLLLACGEPSEPLEAEHDEAATGAARWEPVRRPSDAALLEHPAHVVAGASAQSEIGAPFRARVLRVHVVPGARVEAGDPVLDVVMPEVLDAAALVAGLGPRIAAHRARVEELERLRAERLVEAASVFEQRAALAELEAERMRALAILRAAGLDAGDATRVVRAGSITLRAPSAGVVRTIDAHLGETREAGGAPFARIVGEADARIEVRSPAPLVTASDATFEGADGTIVPLAPEPLARLVDPQDGTHVTWLAPREPVRLSDGLRGRVRLALRGESIFEVPASALVLGEDGAHLVVRRGSRIERVAAEVVSSSGASAIVDAALREGDFVAADPGASEGE